MHSFTIAVQADNDHSGSNHLEVALATNPPRTISLEPYNGASLDVLDEEEFGPADEALYYAVERIAQLEAENQRLSNELQNKADHDEGTAADAYFHCQDIIAPYLGDRCGPNTLSNSVCDSLRFLISEWRKKQ